MPVSGDLHIGDSLLGYEIEALIGRGGMGVVYRARDRALDRRVALKLIAPELAAFTGFRARFLAESRLAASLEHPNVVPIYAAGEQDDLLYIAMRYVEGSDLKRILLDGPLSPKRTVAICGQVASALDAAHELGLVHRDVKPSNVLVDPNDHAFLVDFGLTRLVSDIGQVPIATSSLGTIEYIAPEQIRGDRIDGRADVYSLGCVLHECITGTPPFPHASEVALLFAHLEEEPPANSALGEVLATALAKDPEDRYATCRELVDTAATALEVDRPKRRRWPVIAGALAAAVIALAAGIGLLTRGSPAHAAATGRLIQIDPRTTDVTRTIPIGVRPKGVAVSGARVWATTIGDPRVQQINPRTGAVAGVGTPISEPIDLAASGKLAYVVDDNGIDIINPKIAPSLGSVDTGSIQGDPMLISSGPAGTWGVKGNIAFRVQTTSDYGANSVHRVELPIREDEEHTGGVYTDMAVGTNAVWVIGDVGERRLWRVDVAKPRTVETIPLSFSPAGVAVGLGGVWITDQLSNRLFEIDPASRRIVHVIHVGREPMGVAVGAGAVWVANAVDGTVSRYTPSSGRVDTIEVGGSPTRIAVGAGSIWVAADGE